MEKLPKGYESLLHKENKNNEEWLDNYFHVSQKKFIHNIDTFYYSVKFKDDFRFDTRSESVLKFRRVFEKKYEWLNNNDSDASDFYMYDIDKRLILRNVTFSKFYKVCLSYPEYFDIFFAPVVPKAVDGGMSVTSECVVQIRSYMLWQFGARTAFENSYYYVKKIAEHFGLTIDFVQENRADYCWHTNYLKNPEKFFEPENFYKMRVDRFKNATYVTNKVGSDDYEIDYVALGKRSDKVFVRIYQKTREVIEQNYKPWFFQIWEMNGLINKYDKYVYERCFEKRNWYYRFMARLEFYLEHGKDEKYLEKIRRILSGDETIEEQALIDLANKLTPRLNYVVNVEYQTMRRHSKSYELLPINDNTDKNECKRVYDYLDNHKLIVGYLTHNVFRLVKPDSSKPKKDREPHQFWERLRGTKCIDFQITDDQRKLVRNYNRKLSVAAMQEKVVNSAVMLGLYTRGINHDNPMQDCFEALLRMNDNDMYKAMGYKSKKLRQLNPDELAEVFEADKVHRFTVLDNDTGELINNDTMNQWILQGGKRHDGWKGV